MKMISELKPPKTNTQEVLFVLIKNKSVSFFDFDYMQGFRTRISELVNKCGLKLETTKHSRNNKFGNQFTYHIHSIPKTKDKKIDEEAYKKAIELYKKLCK